MITVFLSFPWSKLIHQFTLIPLIKVTILCLLWSLGANLLHSVSSSSTFWLLAFKLERILTDDVIDSNIHVLTVLTLEINTLVIILSDNIKIVVSVTNSIQESRTFLY